MKMALRGRCFCHAFMSIGNGGRLRAKILVRVWKLLPCCYNTQQCGESQLHALIHTYYVVGKQTPWPYWATQTLRFRKWDVRKGLWLRNTSERNWCATPQACLLAWSKISNSSTSPAMLTTMWHKTAWQRITTSTALLQHSKVRMNNTIWMTPGSFLEYTWLNVISVSQWIDQIGHTYADLYLVFTMFFDTHTGLPFIGLVHLYRKGQHIRGQFVVGMDIPIACLIQASVEVHPCLGWVWYQLLL
jgi:hypothetical protein